MAKTPQPPPPPKPPPAGAPPAPPPAAAAAAPLVTHKPLPQVAAHCTDGGSARTYMAPPGAQREQLGIVIMGTWMGTEPHPDFPKDQKKRVKVKVKSGCPVKGIPEGVMVRLKASRMRISEAPKPPEAERLQPDAATLS